MNELTVSEFIEAVQQASKDGTLILEDGSNRHLLKPKQRWPRNKVVVRHVAYGGARLDRMRDRNKVMAMFGLETANGCFWNLEDKWGGTFMADVLAAYGIDYWLRVDGKRLYLKHDMTYNGSYLSVKPTKDKTCL